MKMFLLSAVAAVAAAGIAPALAQVAAPQPAIAAQHDRMHMMKPITRARVVQMVQARFARADANHDGFVTRDEAQAATQAMHSKMEQRMARRGDSAFDRLDTNHDGMISRAEFDAARAAREQRMAQGDMHGGMAGMHHAGFARMHGGFGGRMFDMADANRDGRVSLQEATGAALRHFDSMDTNHDGVVTPDEMRAAHQRMHARG